MNKLLIILFAVLAITLAAKLPNRELKSVPKLSSKYLRPNMITSKFREHRIKQMDRQRKVTPTETIEGSFESRVDNFNPSNLDTFEHRYLRNAQYYEEGGPVFIFIGGEWRIEPELLEEGIMFDVADDLNGYMFYLEHRYYGDSIPTEDLSTENMQFLNVDQAIADIAHFIDFIVPQFIDDTNTKVFLFGAHYSGSLAMWARQRFPHLIHAVSATGSPLEARPNFFQYKEVAGAVFLDVGGFECYNQIDQGFQDMEEMAANDMDELVRIFDLCGPLETYNDRWLFFQLMGEVLSGISTFATTSDIDEICQIIQDDEPAYGLANLIEIIMEEFDFDGDCLPIDYDYFIEQDRDPSIDSMAAEYGIRQFSYQLCSQLGWFHTSDSRFQPFGSYFPPELFYAACEDVFEIFNNDTLDANTIRFNNAMGGTNLPHLTRIVNTFGQHDPWRLLGIQERLNDFTDAIIVPGAGLVELLIPIDQEDNYFTVMAKMRVRDLFRIWYDAPGDVDLFP